MDTATDTAVAALQACIAAFPKSCRLGSRTDRAIDQARAALELLQRAEAGTQAGRELLELSSVADMAARYLEHPDVRGLPFALPSAAVSARLRVAIGALDARRVAALLRACGGMPTSRVEAFGPGELADCAENWCAED